MHQLNVLICGPVSFLNTINELKPFLKFNHFTEKLNKNYDIILFHDESFVDKQKKDYFSKSKSLKICASSKKDVPIACDAILKLPTTVKEINLIIENIAAKNKFNRNSSIKVKKYMLNKNEKKLSNKNSSVILTEKEVQLIELLLHM